MSTHTLDTFQTWLRQMIDMAVSDDCAPGDIAIVLREEASRLSEAGYRTGDWATVYELPSDDPRIDTYDVLAQVIAGSITGGSIRFHGLELHHHGNERWASLWSVHEATSGTFLQWLNARTFRTARDLEAHLHELDAPTNGD